jgi:excisionase family DNA binding protein
MADATSPEPTPPAIGRLVTTKHAAAVCGVHPYTIRRWIAEGRLRGYRSGPKLIRVNLDDVAALIVPTV